MESQDETKIAECAYEVAGLARHAPDLELIAVAADLVKVFVLIKSELLLKIVATMVVINEHIVIG